MPATWKGSLSFGLVSIPIQLSPAARTERISFNQLHKVCHTRLKQPLFCPTCNRMVERSEVEKGYEYEKDQYLLFTEEELERVEPESARIMEILEFVKLDEIDPLYFDSSYYATPEAAGAKAYRLLHEAMLRTGYAGIAKVTMHSREYIIIVRPRKNGLTLHTMFYSNEIRPAAETGTDKFEVREQERALATQLIESLAAPFEPEKYHDTYQDALRTLIDAKAEGQDVVAVHPAVQAPPVDLMAALKQSLMQKPQRGEKKSLLRVVPKGEAAAEAPAAKKSRRKVG
ncbi:MAG TPA: Ku protein [Candidatus Limnocylindrales bacterium]|nr:Ku protein [Candidatus Limnocylindrales bacterium]